MSLIKLYGQAYKGLSRETWFLSLVILINRSGTMVVPFMTMYATQRLHFSITQAGIIMALFGCGAVVGSYLGGKLSDLVGFYNIQLFGLFSGGLMFIGLGYLTSYTAICIGSFVLSALNESFRPANSTAIAYYSTPGNRTRSYSLNRLSINLGWAVGGALGGFLAGQSYQLLFWVDGITNISAGFLLLIVLKSPKALKQSIADNKLQAASSSSVYKDRDYMLFILLTVLFAFCFFQMFTILPVFYRMELGLTEMIIGSLMAFNGIIIAFTEMVLVYNLEGRRSPLWYIKYGVLLVGLSFAVFNFYNGGIAIAFISMLIITVGEMLALPFMNTYWTLRSKEYNRGQYAALYSMAWATAQIAGPSFGGYIADQYGFTLLWWIIFGLTIVASIGYMQLDKRKSA